MKKRALLTNIFIIVLMISIVFVLLAFFEIFPASLQSPVLLVSMVFALISVALVDIVFPFIDNLSRFKTENSYKVKSIIKVILFIVAVIFLLLTVKGIGIFKTQFLGIALFCVAYLAQFFIDLDKNKNADEKDTESDEEENSEEAEFEIDDEDEFVIGYVDEEDNK